MFNLRKAIVTYLILLVLLFVPQAYGEPILFVVKNNTSSTMTGLEISSNNQTWSPFEGVHLSPGLAANFSWNPVSGSPCIQYIRGKFSNGETSEASSVNFCAETPVSIAFGL